MERQHSNVSLYSYQDYQPTRRYGPQYEPGGYAAVVQQRTNMTQREDALKFEQGRIKALQEERLHIQKKTFTKWMNSFLQKARMEVDDLFVDLADGRRLLKLLEIISGERLPRPNTGRMRVHKIENVNKSLSFLHTKVRLESIGAEDIVDGNPRLILGLIWTIILRFQIQEIEIDVDEENESSEKKSAKDALLLWCQRKTSGYHGVHIHNFTDSWRSGLGFNALIHSHRPDLFRWADVPGRDHVETLNHAFDVAHNQLGIPPLLDAEDVDTTRPDEKSVMTYVASYYHTFARMKNEQKSGRRIANIIGQLMELDARKSEYSRLLSNLLEWIRAKILELNDREVPNSLDGIQRLLLGFKQYRTVEKPPKYKERSEIEVLYFDINTMQKSLLGDTWAPLEGQLPHDLERAWQQLEQAEHAREIALRTELLRQQRLEQLNYKFNTKSVLRKGYLKEMIQVLSDPRYGSNLAQVDATVKKHEAISADILARTERFEDLSAMAGELIKEKYHGAEAVQATEQAVLSRWKELLQLLEKHRAALASLAHLMALVRESDAVQHSLNDMKCQFQSEEVGRHLVDVERLVQAHALQELQLTALDESIRRLVRQGATATGPEAPRKQLHEQLKRLEDEYDSLVAAAKDRKARLEDARNLYQFLEDHEEEEGWVTDKQRICRTDVAAKDVRGVVALRTKHAGLATELGARDHVAQRHRDRGHSLIESNHPKSAEIERRLSSLTHQWQVLRELADLRQKQLNDAVEAYQFYGDANSAESYIKEKRPLVASADRGTDEPSAAALLARHRALHEEITAYSAELKTLQSNAEKLIASGITTLQLPTEVDSPPTIEEEEWVNETRLVPTEVWEEEPQERLEHRTVWEERSVPQVKALYPFSGQGISMTKGEVMFLISKTNPDWWSVRKADRSDGFVPANYVREIEPRLVPVQVRRPEKVRTIQRVKKTVLVKQVVPVRKAARPARRPSKVAVTTATPTVKDRLDGITRDYDELLSLSSARRLQLEDAIKLYSLFAECDDLDKWMKDKERMLNEEEDTVETGRRKYEKFVTDLSAASKRLEHIDTATADLVKAKHAQANAAVSRKQQLHAAWDRLLKLKQEKEKSLEGASSVELFSRTCDEALDWMSEKEQQLKLTPSPMSDLRTVRALQRRHAQLERELEPLKDKLRKVSLLADSVKSQYPLEREHVESRQREISAMWARCESEARDKRRRLESAVGHEIFSNSSDTLHHWIQNTREQIAQDVSAKDVATAEALKKQHQELKDDIKAHHDEFVEVIGLGKKLLSNNPSLTDVAEKIKTLEDDYAMLDKEWLAQDAYLTQCVQLASFTREADQIDASSGAHEAYLELTDNGSSVDEVEALLKRHEELEARLAAQDDKLGPFVQHAEALINKPHYAAEQITSRLQSVLSRRSSVRSGAAQRRRDLHSSLHLHQLLEAVEDLHHWIQDKYRTASDQSYRDLTNLERKLQKHEAFERELQANEKQLRNVDSVGQSLMKSDPARATEISSKLGELHKAWEQLVATSRDKGAKLRQARSQRTHKRSIEDAKARVAELERALTSKEVGTDLRSCKRLLNQHQALEQELANLEQKCTALASEGTSLSSGHFDGASIERSTAGLLGAVGGLAAPAGGRRRDIETQMQFHKFSSEVSASLEWVSERLLSARSSASPLDLLSAQTAVKRHAKLRNEIAGRAAVIEKVLQRGEELVEEGHPDQEKIKALSAELQDAYTGICEAADARAARLEASLKAQQFLHEASEVESWLSDKGAALSSADVGGDRHRATQLLTRHKAVELELDTYAAIIAEMGHVATNMANSGHQEAEALVERYRLLAESLQRLQRLAAHRLVALVESVCRHEYLAESGELEEWIQEQYTAASSEDYGQDYEHLLVLRGKFDELRHRVESGAERFNQCEELAKKLLASESPYIQDIEKRQEALGPDPKEEALAVMARLRDSWQRLVEQIQSRGTKLVAAGDIHRFHRDVAELLTRIGEKRTLLANSPVIKSLPQATRAARDHDTLENDLLAIEAQLQVLQDEAARLQKLYPGGNVQQISKQQKALDEAWTALRSAADNRKEQLNQQLQLQQLFTQIRDLTSWCVSLQSAMSAECRVRDAHSAQTQRAEHDGIKAEIEAREDTFRETLDKGAEMVDYGHPNSQEIEEKCSQLLEERTRLHAAWAARQVALDQLIDLHCFLRDATQLHDLCAQQEAHTSVEISPTLSVEEVDNLLKKHEAFEKLLNTQDEKLSTLNTHGDKLLQQNHVESQRIADELRTLNERRKKVHELAAMRRAALQRALTLAQFNRDVTEARTWVADKLKKLQKEPGGTHSCCRKMVKSCKQDLNINNPLTHKHSEVTSLEDKMKKLQKHQAFSAELSANAVRVKEVSQLAALLRPDPTVAVAVQGLERDWGELVHATDQRGRGLEEAQDILEFNQHLDKIEAWIRDKEMMVQAHELGRDYEHCSALVRKLDDLDSDMKVDDKQVKNICALADKLLQQGPSQQSEVVSRRRDQFVSKWRALSGALQHYREQLNAALEIHAFNRDISDTMDRIGLKSSLFSSTERGRDLGAVYDLYRRHEGRVTETKAVKDKIDSLETEGRRLTENYPAHREHIETSLASLRADWDKLQQLAARRSELLDDALAEHKFDDSVKELEVWVTESIKRMSSSDPPESVTDAEGLIQLHQERKAEIDGRQKSIAALKKQAETQLAGREDLPEKLRKVDNLSAALDEAWLQRKNELTQAHELQLFKDQARSTEDWLAAKEAFLNNDDLGENMAAVEALTRKHGEFTKLLESQIGKVDELATYAAKLTNGGHAAKEYINKRVDGVQQRAGKLKELCKYRAARLDESRQLQQFLTDLGHEMDWIALKMQVANDHNYRELSNLQSKIQRHEAFESELTSNRNRIEDVVNRGEELIEANHYAAQEITGHVEELESQWRELQSASKLRGERLAEAYQARVYLREVDEFTAWLDEVESQLLSEDHGTDLTSTSSLLSRHGRLEAAVTSKHGSVQQISENARQLADAGHFMAEQILDRSETAVKRYRQLLEPMQIRRDNLEDAAQLHRWERDADEELRWLKERTAAATMEDTGSNLAQAQALQKKHVALEAELIAREPAISAVSSRASQLSRCHFAASQLDSRNRELTATYNKICDAAQRRTQRLRERIDTLHLLSELTEAEAYLVERRTPLSSPDYGKDEDSVLGLQKRLEAVQRDLANFDGQIQKLDKAGASLIAGLQERSSGDSDIIKTKVENLKQLHEDLKLLSAKREQRLQQSLKYFKFVRECMEVEEWISSQMSIAASEDYGLDVEHVDTLQQAFDNFLNQLNASDGRIESVCEAGNALLEENTPEADRVKQRIEDIRGLWEDLKELALARQEALAGARQVHEFDRSAEETVSWIVEKEASLTLHSSSSRAIHHDLHAIRDKHTKLQEQAGRLGAQFPDAREHVMSKLEEVTESLTALEQRALTTQHQTELATQLQAYFDRCQELLAWCTSALAAVTSPLLGADVAAGEALLNRHKDLHLEIRAKDDQFNQLYKDGEKLVTEGHFMSGEISSRMDTLRARHDLLLATWEERRVLYTHHLDALVFKRDADALLMWIQSREPLVRDNKLGDNVAQVEELINKHKDLEGTIEAQRDRANALKRITLVEQAFKQQQDAEAAARKKSLERAEAERVEMFRRREVERITAIRRREGGEMEVQQSSDKTAEDTISPAPQFDKLPKSESSTSVKRAESMQVVKTPKRTPSFTTRRRTQSFRRHLRPDVAELPPVEIEGYLERKQEWGAGGKRATVRSWRGYYSVLCGQLLCFFRDEADFASAKAAAPPMGILHAKCSPAGDYTKRPNVFRLSCQDGAEFLFSVATRELMSEWVNKLSFHAALPPELQLTPYGQGEEPNADIKRRLHENASSSSSPSSSPEPQRHRTQAEILTEHRNSQPNSERHIESAVLPSLPPRQPDNHDATDATLRNSEVPPLNWGRSRFSNGRDISAEFIRSQQETAPPLPLTLPPMIPDRPPKTAERPKIAERDRVPNLVSSYQQRFGRSERENNNIAPRPANNNWQNVESSTSHFYTNDLAYGASQGNTRPASVAGSGGGSPALDQRPASRSSGESELSVSSARDKKDKKGVFGGLFSRKKKDRPHSHM